MNSFASIVTTNKIDGPGLEESFLVGEVRDFKDIIKWKSLVETNQQNDKEKMIKCIENGLSVLRIYQPDIWRDTIDWRQEIKNNLIKRKLPITIFISKNENIYTL